MAGAAIADLRWHVELLASDSDQALQAASRAHAAWQVDAGSAAVVVNDRHLIQGGQPVEVFEQALCQLATAQ